MFVVRRVYVVPVQTPSLKFSKAQALPLAKEVYAGKYGGNCWKAVREKYPEHDVVSAARLVNIYLGKIKAQPALALMGAAEQAESTPPTTQPTVAKSPPRTGYNKSGVSFQQYKVRHFHC